MTKKSDTVISLLKEISGSLKSSQSMTRQDRFKSHLSEAGFKFGAKPLNQKSYSKSSITSEKNTLQKMVIGMAIKGYQYDPEAKRTNTVSEIQSDLALLGIDLDKNTILKWLKESAKFLPGNAEKN